MATLRIPGYSGLITTPHGNVELVNGEATIDVDRKTADADIKPLPGDASDDQRSKHAARLAAREDARANVRMVEHFLRRGYSVAGVDEDPAPIVTGRRRRDTASGQPKGAAASKEQEGVGEEVGPISTAVTEPNDGPSADELAAQVAARQEARGT